MIPWASIVEKYAISKKKKIKTIYVYVVFIRFLNIKS